jgi:hypothetical protein
MYLEEVLNIMSSIHEDVKNLLKSLYTSSPAFNVITQALFMLPLKARVFWRMYPELEEYEEAVMGLFSLKYTEKGFIESTIYGLGHHLTGLYRVLFTILMNINWRARLLKIANISEEEFKEFDPLRAWLEVSMEYLSKTDKDALKILEVIIAKLLGKRSDDSISWDEIKRSVEKDVKNFDASLENLKRFSLIYYESPLFIYARNCPLLLEVYSDLRNRLKELLR